MTENVVWQSSSVDPEVRASITGGRGVTVWMTGLSGSGKSTIARQLESLLVSRRRSAYVLDGDNLRHGLNGDLGFSPQERSENVRRLGEVALLMADAGLVVIVPAISPYEADRARIRRRHELHGVPFFEIFVDTPIEVCEQRDPKGLYRKARSGEIRDFTGISAPYEQPMDPDLTIATESHSVDEATSLIGELLARH